MSDDRWSEESTPPVAPCRRYIAPRQNDYVTADEMDAWLDGFEREFKLGKYRKPKPQQPPIAPAPSDRGEGQFGTESAESEQEPEVPMTPAAGDEG